MVRTTQNIGISNVVVYSPVTDTPGYFVGTVVSLQVGKVEQDILGLRVLRLGLPGRSADVPTPEADLEANNFQFLSRRKPVREQGSGVTLTAECPFEDLVSIDRIKRIYGGRQDTTLRITEEWKKLYAEVSGGLRLLAYGPLECFMVTVGKRGKGEGGAFKNAALGGGELGEVPFDNVPLGEYVRIGAIVAYRKSTFLAPWELAVGRVVQVYATPKCEKVRMFKVLRYGRNIRGAEYDPVYSLHGWDDFHHGTFTETHEMVDLRIEDLRFVMKGCCTWASLRTSPFQIVHDVGIRDKTRTSLGTEDSTSSDSDSDALTDGSGEGGDRNDRVTRMSQSGGSRGRGAVALLLDIVHPFFLLVNIYRP